MKANSPEGQETESQSEVGAGDTKTHHHEDQRQRLTHPGQDKLYFVLSKLILTAYGSSSNPLVKGEAPEKNTFSVVL